MVDPYEAGEVAIGEDSMPSDIKKAVLIEQLENHGKTMATVAAADFLEHGYSLPEIGRRRTVSSDEDQANRAYSVGETVVALALYARKLERMTVDDNAIKQRDEEIAMLRERVDALTEELDLERARAVPLPAHVVTELNELRNDHAADAGVIRGQELRLRESAETIRKLVNVAEALTKKGCCNG